MFDEDIGMNSDPAEESPRFTDEPEQDTHREDKKEGHGVSAAGELADIDDAEGSPETGDAAAGQEEEQGLIETDDLLKEKDPDRHILSDEIELERADEGLAVRLSHGGEQELDELLKSPEEREQEYHDDEPEIIESEDFDEAAEKEKRERNLLKDRQQRQRDREFYRRQDEYYRRQAEENTRYTERKNSEDSYDQMIRERYERDGYTQGKIAREKPAETASVTTLNEKYGQDAGTEGMEKAGVRAGSGAITPGPKKRGIRLPASSRAGDPAAPGAPVNGNPAETAGKQRTLKGARRDRPSAKPRELIMGQRPLPGLTMGQKEWTLTRAKKKSGDRHLRTDSATREYYRAKRARSGMIRMEKSGEKSEDEEDFLLRKRDRFSTKERPLGKRVNTSDVRGVGKIRAAGSAKKTAGALAGQAAAAKAGSFRILRYLNKRGQGPGSAGGQDENDNGASSGETLKRLFFAAAKKVVAGITATAIGLGAMAGTSTVSGMSGNGIFNYYYPIQAHTELSEADPTTMTQEVLRGMADRMKAYGIPLSLTGSATAGNGTIRIHVPGYNVPGSGYNAGDSQIITDGNGNCLVIDGGCGELCDKMIDYLKQQSITEISIMVTHWHEDHSRGFVKLLEEESQIHINKMFCIPPAENVSWVPTTHGDILVQGVVNQGGEVVYITPDRLSSISVGGLRMTVWRESSPPSRDGDTHINDMSIQVYFPDLYYLTTGDILYEMGNFLDLMPGAIIKCIKVPHHGNGSRHIMARLHDEFHTEIAWDNTVNGISSFEVGSLAAKLAGMTVIETNGDMEFAAENCTMRISCDGQTLSYQIPYTGGGAGGTSGTIMQQVCDYAKSWVGKIPYKSSVTGDDPNDERKMDLKEGRGSDCSWFVYHVLKHFDLVGDTFIHSYEWGNDPKKYPNFKHIGTDMTMAIPGDVLCTGKGTAPGNSHVGIYVGDGKWVECAAGRGTVLSDAPKNPRQIVRYNGAGTGPVMGSAVPGEETRYGFSPQTEKIVADHIHDFTYDNFDSFMAQHGGVKNYIRSLGGVFAKWCDRPANVQTSADLQEIAEYVMGLYTIWGADYNGAGKLAFNDDNGQDGRFYRGQSPGPHGFTQSGTVEDMFCDKYRIITDCGSGVARIMQKAGIAGTQEKTEDVGTPKSSIDPILAKYSSQGSALITKVEDLQVGDLLQFIKPNGMWLHVALVGEIWDDGTIVTYDTGKRFVGTANYKHRFVSENGVPKGDYTGYIEWYAIRLKPITQNGGLSGGGSSRATKDLKKIDINSVKVDGHEVSRDSVTWDTLGAFTYDGASTSSVTKVYEFYDRLGNLLGSSSTSTGSAVTGRTGGGFGGYGSGKAADVLRVAESHLDSPYVWGGDDWKTGVDCSHFVTKVLQEAGVYDGPYMTSYGWAKYGQRVDSLAQARAGDIIVSNGGGHVSIYDGNGGVYAAVNSATGCAHKDAPQDITAIRRVISESDAGTSLQQTSGTASPSGGVSSSPSGSGQVIEIPEGLGTCYTYMGWQMITSVSSRQYKLREQAGMNFDHEGFGVINGRYVIACTQTFGEVGDYVDFYNTNGLIFHCVIGEIKSSRDDGYSIWGHHNGANIIEFVVDKDEWYPKGYDNPGTPSNHPEWKGSINKAVNLGSYFDDPGATHLASASGVESTGMTGTPLDKAAMYLMKQILSMSALGSYYDDPADIDRYGNYCYDLIDYAVCHSHGADVEYTTIFVGTERQLKCTATLKVICSLPLMEENDENFTSWERGYPDGDLMPTHYMELSKDDFEVIFNVDTSVRNLSSLKNDPGFTGVQAQVYNYFKQKGYGPAQIAGIMANIEKESNFEPKADNGHGAYGMFQWMGGRFDALRNLAASRGTDWTDVYAQLDYAYEEIHSGSGWNGNYEAKQKFESTEDPYEAGVLLSKYFERHGIESENAKRGELAREYYNKIVANAGSSIAYVQWAIDIANDDSHGYNMYARGGNPDYDCSSLVYFALKNTGFDVGSSPFCTGDMYSILTRAGFKNVQIGSESELLPGDIVWWDGPGYAGHTEIYVGNGQFVGAHSNYDGRPGDSGGNEISVGQSGTDWHQAFRLQ